MAGAPGQAWSVDSAVIIFDHLIMVLCLNSAILCSQADSVHSCRMWFELTDALTDWRSWYLCAERLGVRYCCTDRLAVTGASALRGWVSGTTALTGWGSLVPLH